MQKVIAGLFLVLFVPTLAIAGDLPSVAFLNARVERAVAAEAEWPKTPGGMAGRLFGLRAMVMPHGEEWKRERATSYVVFPDADGVWREAGILKQADGTWRVVEVEICDEARATEAAAELAARRARYKESCGLDYVAESPLDFIETLRAREGALRLHPVIPSCWIDESHLPALFALIDSDERCAGVINTLSSTIVDSMSTVGDQAAYMIEGFRKDRYPPGLLTTVPYPDKAGLKSWWRNRNDRRGATGLAPGSDVRLTLVEPKFHAILDPKRIRGRVAWATDDEIALEKKPGEAPVVVPRSNIEKVELNVRTSRRKRGALIGLGAGAAAGFFTGAVIVGDSRTRPNDWLDTSPLENGLVGAAVFASVGALVGALVAPGDRWETLEPGGVSFGAGPSAHGGAGLRVSFRF